MEELEKDPRISQKIKRFRNKQAQMKHIFTEVSNEFSWLILLLSQNIFKGLLTGAIFCGIVNVRS